VVWFTFPGEWHDIGRFHRADGTFTGFYANILTPVEMEGDRWSTTDLCLDVWLGADGGATLLDAEEFSEARESGWLDGETAARAEREAERLLTRALQERWPPPLVREWTLERARAALR
jgi:predicted RNA-binding protein associated with RNAse of E/G family